MSRMVMVNETRLKSLEHDVAYWIARGEEAERHRDAVLQEFRHRLGITYLTGDPGPIAPTEREEFQRQLAKRDTEINELKTDIRTKGQLIAKMTAKQEKGT